MGYEVSKEDGKVAAGAEKEAEGKQEEPSRPPPNPLLSLLQSTTGIVDAMLSDQPLNSKCLVAPYTDSSRYTLAYLCSWILYLDFISAVPDEVQYHYLNFLREKKLMHSLLNHLLLLLPDSAILAGTEDTMFSCKPLLTTSKGESSEELQHLACQVYLLAMQILPAFVRSWYSELDKSLASSVDQFTAKYVSPILCEDEIQAVQGAEKSFVNMTVKTRKKVREVIASYAVDDSKVELVVRLPSNHPLCSVSIETGKRVGVTEKQWRTWQLQLTTFLQHQNGSLVHGLGLWNRNINKRFEGLEECYICFHVIHGTTHHVPQIPCRTCKKKFHSACLRRWFETKTITKFLNGKGIFTFPSEWVEACIDWIKVERNGCLPVLNELKELVLEQWLLSDLRELATHVLPHQLSLAHKRVLTGPFALQMNWVRDVGRPSYVQLQRLQKVDTSNLSVYTMPQDKEQGEESTVHGHGGEKITTNRMLMMELTDGAQGIKAMEYQPIPLLSPDLKPGTKVLISGKVECRRGVLMLKSEHVQVLGGEVDILMDTNKQENLLARHLELQEGREKVKGNQQARVTSAMHSKQPVPTEGILSKIPEDDDLCLHNFRNSEVLDADKCRSSSISAFPSNEYIFESEVLNDGAFLDDDDLLLSQLDESQLTGPLEQQQQPQVSSAVEHQVFSRCIPQKSTVTELIPIAEPDSVAMDMSPMKTALSSARAVRTDNKCNPSQNVSIAKHVARYPSFPTTSASSSSAYQEPFSLKKPVASQVSPSIDNDSIFITKAGPSVIGRGSTFKPVAVSLTAEKSSIILTEPQDSSTLAKPSALVKPCQDEWSRHVLDDLEVINLTPKQQQKASAIPDEEIVKLKDIQRPTVGVLGVYVVVFIYSLTSTLKTTSGTAWHLVVLLKDPSASLEANFHDSVLEKLIGFSALEASQMKHEAKVSSNSSVRHQLIQTSDTKLRL
ncbi:unnamed protein product [Darwinula stevensoni]|uniref:E3 ubiquitin-protein ligase listerin n=1 Tax=Darwinula stevensoni TaxID=69355 RepID=A0A7R8X6H0_9CRUS|nr:unnamed protein product [Darwinula stevensoni]CAG0887601.1 unnamed protein product [Darwinula stevensoni]